MRLFQAGIAAIILFLTGCTDNKKQLFRHQSDAYTNEAVDSIISFADTTALYGKFAQPFDSFKFNKVIVFRYTSGYYEGVRADGSKFPLIRDYVVLGGEQIIDLTKLLTDPENFVNAESAEKGSDIGFYFYHHNDQVFAAELSLSSGILKKIHPSGQKVALTSRALADFRELLAGSGIRLGGPYNRN